MRCKNCPPSCELRHGARSPFAGFAALGKGGLPTSLRPSGAMTSDVSAPLSHEEKIGLGVSLAIHLAWGGFGYYLTKHKWPVLGTFFMVGSGIGLVATTTGAALAAGRA